MISHIKKRKEMYLLIMLLSLAVFVMFLPSLIKGGYFVGGGDVKTQWFEFYVLNKRTTLNTIKDKTFPFYSYILFLGSNLWASKSSYGLFDVYNILSYFFNENYFVIYDVQCFVKIIVSGVSFFFLIDSIYKNKKVSFVGGLSYALSSYCIYYTSQPSFLSFYSLVPLYFLGIENYLKENKKLIFITVTFLLLITNYYFFYAASIFSPIYFAYRYYNIKKTLKGFIKKALVLITYYLIGVLLSAIVIVPVFLFIIQNERVGNALAGLTFSDISMYYHLIMAAFVPSHTYIYGNNVFVQGAHTMNEILLYSGSIITLLVPQFLTDKDRKFKTSTSILFLVLIIMMLIPFFDSIMNGFSEPCFRWLFLFIIMNIIVTCNYLNSLGKINKKNLLITCVVEILLIFMCFFGGLKYKNYELNNYGRQAVLLLVTIVATSLNAWLILKNNKIYIIVAIVELISFAGFYGNKSTESSVSKSEIETLTSVLADNDNYYNLSDYLNSLDKENYKQYYRIYVPYNSLYWGFSHNLNIPYNINGLMTYDSTYNQSFNKMRTISRDKVVGFIDWEFDIKDKNIIDFLSTKYSITTTKEEIPFNNYRIIDNNYRGTLIVSLNVDYRPIGTTYSKSITYEDMKNKYNYDTSLLNEYIITDNNSNLLLGNDDSSMNNVQYYDNYFYGEVNSIDDTFMVLGIPYDKGWKIINNGEQIEFIECNGGMMGFPIKQGKNIIEMYFVPEGFKIGAICSIVGFVLFIIVIVDDKRKLVK